MRIQIALLKTALLTLSLATRAAFAAGIPEPGLLMYGAVRDTAAGSARLITGTLTWTITPTSGSPVTVTTPLTGISGQSASVTDVRRLHLISDLKLEARHPGGHAEWSFST